MRAKFPSWSDVNKGSESLASVVVEQTIVHNIITVTPTMFPIANFVRYLIVPPGTSYVNGTAM